MGSFILGAKKVTPSSADDTWQGGYYDATTLTGIDSDLVAGNIKNGVSIFGVNGTIVPGVDTPYPLKDTSITTVYTTGDDGTYQVNQPSYGSVVNGCVVDSRTGLMWPVQPDLAVGGGYETWKNAIGACEGLTYGGYSDWRLPTIRELASLLDYRTQGGLICVNSDIFTVWGDGRGYWSSTSCYVQDAYQSGVFENAWAMVPASGTIAHYRWTVIDACSVWPVRFA